MKKSAVSKLPSRLIEDRDYWCQRWRQARRFRVNLAAIKWCNWWHEHLDWQGRCRASRFERQRLIRLVLLVLNRAQRELAAQPVPFQLFAGIVPHDPGADAVFVHTPNPYSDFPLVFESYVFGATVPPRLLGLLDPERYLIGVTVSEGRESYLIFPR